jgi:hypothetical protein
MLFISWLDNQKGVTTVLMFCRLCETFLSGVVYQKGLGRLERWGRGYYFRCRHLRHSVLR